MMMNLFAIAPKDASICYLSKVFGNVSGVIVCQDPSIGLGGSITLLSTMFKSFNSVILVIAVLMLVYVTVLGVIGTAHEGEFMGKKMNNIWIPIRAVLGIALLVPTGAGYCGIQILMMWVIVQGVGAADMLWNTAVSYVDTVGSPYAQVSVPVTGKGMTLNGLFQGLVCDASLRKGDPKKLGKQACTEPGGCGQTPSFDSDKSVYQLGDNGSCGTLVYCNQGSTTAPGGVEPSCSDANTMQCYACKAQIKALELIIPTFAGIAQQLVAADYSYRDFYVHSSNIAKNPEWQWIYKYCAAHDPIIPTEQCCVGTADDPNISCHFANQMPDPDRENGSASSDVVKSIYWPYWPQLQPALGGSTTFKTNAGGTKTVTTDVEFVDAAKAYYGDLANGAVTSYITAQKNNGGENNSLLKVVGSAQDFGWIYAGALYYQLASLNSNRLKGSVTELEWSLPMEATKIPRNNIDAAGYLVGVAAQGPGASSNKNIGGSGSGVNDLKGSIVELTDSFQTTVTNTGDVNPLLLLQIFGSLMLRLAEVIFGLAILIVLAVGLGAGINVLVIGTGVLDPLSAWAPMMTIFIVPAFWAGVGLLVTIGALISIYTPLLPYIYFTFGALFWIVSTVEAMVAGPLVALGIINPKGDSELLGKAEPALGLLFNIFLRPSLMIFGLMAAMLLAVVGVMMVNATFKYVILITDKDPLTLIFMLVAYVSIILAVLNKCFAVINLIPQQVMRWISIQGEAVETPLQELKGQMDAASGQASGAMGGTGDRMKGAQDAHRQAKREKEQEEREKAREAREANISPSTEGGGGKGGSGEGGNTPNDSGEGS